MPNVFFQSHTCMSVQWHKSPVYEVYLSKVVLEAWDEEETFQSTWDHCNLRERWKISHLEYNTRREFMQDSQWCPHCILQHSSMI